MVPCRRRRMGGLPRGLWLEARRMQHGCNAVTDSAAISTAHVRLRI
jgi:hypothetical protein